MNSKRKALSVLKVLVLVAMAVFLADYAGKTIWTKVFSALYYDANSSYSAWEVSFDKGFSPADIDKALRDSGGSYNGFIPKKSLVEGQMTLGKKTLQEEFIILNQYVDKEHLVDKKTETIPEDCIAAYRSGWELEKYDIGERFTIKLTDKDGREVLINAVLAGDCNLSLLSGLVEGQPRWEANRGTIALVGLDIEEFVENPYGDVYMYSNDAVNFTDYYSINKSDDNRLERFHEDSYVNSIIRIESLKGTRIVYIILLAVLFSAAVYFVGTKKKSLNYLIYAGIFAVVSIIEYLVKYANGKYYRYVAAEFDLYYWLFVGLYSLLVTIIAVTLYFIAVKKKKIINAEKENSDAKTPKYYKDI